MDGDSSDIAAAIEALRSALRRDVEEARAARKNVYVPLSVEAWLERLARAARRRDKDPRG